MHFKGTRGNVLYASIQYFCVNLASIKVKKKKKLK